MPQLKHKKTWILTGNQDYTPAGVLQLGQILTDYTDPNSAILTEGTAPIPINALKNDPTHGEINYGSSDAHHTAFQAWLKATLNITARANFTSKRHYLLRTHILSLLYLGT
ncbi:hypothetical protein GGI43DRAFT_397756 [Trichoderma evansii]